MSEKINLIDYIQKINSDLNENTKEIFKEENEVSELHIHKILFIVYGAFYNKFKKELFEPNFQAWKYGPVEIDFRNYFKNKDSNLLRKFDYEFKNNEEKEFLSKQINKLLKFSAWSLVEYTHSLPAWINNYNNQNEKVISKEDIFNSFKNKKFD